MSRINRSSRRGLRRKGEEEEREERDAHAALISGVDAGTEVPILRVPSSFAGQSLAQKPMPIETEEAELNSLRLKKFKKDPFAEKELGTAGRKQAKAPPIPASWIPQRATFAFSRVLTERRKQRVLRLDDETNETENDEEE